MKKYKYSILLLLIDFLLLNASYFAINYYKRTTFHLAPLYIKLLFIYYAIWLCVSVLTKKFKASEYENLTDVFVSVSKSAIFSIYIVSLIVVLAGLSKYSRIQVFGTWGLFFASEIVVILIYDILTNAKTESSLIIILSDLLLFIVSFLLINILKRHSILLPESYTTLFLIMIGVWFIASLITKKFNRRSYHGSYINAFYSCIKANFIMVASMSVLVFGLRLFKYSRLQIYGSILLLMLLEFVLYYFYYTIKSSKTEDNDIETIEDVRKKLNQEELQVDYDKLNGYDCNAESIQCKLQDKFLSDNPWLFGFIKKNIELETINENYANIISSYDLYNVKVLDSNSQKIFINLHKLNDVRWINRYFLEVHRLLFNGGYFIGKAHTIATHKDYIFHKYPIYFRDIIYSTDFFFRRIFPKLPVVKKLYFFVTKGRNRIVSKAEILGRLHFCGFKVIAEEVHEKRLYFIAQKLKTVSVDKSPSYGPLVKFKRIGIDNRIIYTYKFRTMHPYSEYLQEYIYYNNKLAKGGKFNDDFRISGYGKLMRKTFIDEIPMIYNWLKGDLKIIGFRPLSLHYFRLYDKELQELRKGVKPGLIPPFYADLPETFDEICVSEKNYIKAYLQAPLKTQWKYFWRAQYNIWIKGARSK